MCLLAICISSLKKCLFRSSAQFLFGFLLLLYELFSYFGNEALVGLIICKYFIPLCKFFSFMVSFAVQKLVSLIKSHLFIFAFISIALGN